MKVLSNAESNTKTIEHEGLTYVRVETIRDYVSEDFIGEEGEWISWYRKDGKFNVDEEKQNQLEQIYKSKHE